MNANLVAAGIANVYIYSRQLILCDITLIWEQVNQLFIFNFLFVSYSYNLYAIILYPLGDICGWNYLPFNVSRHYITLQNE